MRLKNSDSLVGKYHGQITFSTGVKYAAYSLL